MKKLLFYLALLFLFIITLSAASNASNTLSEEDTIYWQELVKEKEKEILRINKVVDFYLKPLDKEISEIKDFRETSESRVNQLRFSLVTEVFNPYALRMNAREICLVVENYYAEYRRANKLLDDINSLVETIEAIKKSIDILLYKEVPADVKTSLDSMKADILDTNVHVVPLRDRLKTELLIYDKDTKIIANNLSKFKSMVRERIIHYYVVPSLMIYHPKAWFVVGIIYKDWFPGFLHKFFKGIPDFQNEWEFLAGSFLVGIFVFLLGWFFLDKFFKKEEASRKVFRKGLFWFTLSAVFFCYSSLIDFYPRLYFNYHLIGIFLLCSIMYVAWGFRCKEGVPDVKPPFVPMFWLFVYGLTLQFIDIYLPVLGVLWCFGIVTNLFCLKKQKNKNYLPFEKVLLIISIVLYICGIALVFCGLIYLSILMLLTWFLVCLTVQLGISVNTSSRKIVEYFAGGSHSLLKIIVIGITAPVVWLVMIITMYFWLIVQVFGAELLVVDLKTPIHIHGVPIHLSYVAFGVYLFFVFRTISNMIKITTRKLVSTSKIKPGAAPSISLLAFYVLWSLYFIILLNLLGVNLTNIVVVTGGLSVGLGFGLRDIVDNFLSSLIILLSHSIRHGDIIEIDGIVGKVLEITMRSTVVQTDDNAIVVIPNSEIISKKLINWTGNNSAVKKDIKIGVPYDSDVEKVKYILLDIAKNVKHVLGDPSPLVVVNEFANGLVFVLSVWVDDIRSASSITSLIREKINAEFKSNRIEMANPQLDVHLRKDKEYKYWI